MTYQDKTELTTELGTSTMIFFHGTFSRSGWDCISQQAVLSQFLVLEQDLDLDRVLDLDQILGGGRAGAGGQAHSEHEYLFAPLEG